MEGLLEFLFGAGGRINRAKYWRSILIYIGAGLMTAVILFTAAGIAAPLFILMAVVVLLPWLLSRLSFTTGGCTTATGAHGGLWYSTLCPALSANWQRLHGSTGSPVQFCTMS